MISGTALQKKFLASSRAFFDHAEARRRWSLAEDIPWASVKRRAVGEHLVAILESFYCVEMFLPDYNAKLLQTMRSSRGLSGFQLGWGYEESKHSRAIEEWLLRSGHRTEKQLEDLADRLFQKEWSLPHDTARRMFIYTTFQELATQVNYVGLSKLCRAAQDPALTKMLLLVGADEGNHHRFFVSAVRSFLEDDREGTLQDIAHVLGTFEMPAHELVPDWEQYAKEIEASGIYGPKTFVRDVLRPSLKRLGVERGELRRAIASIQ